MTPHQPSLCSATPHVLCVTVCSLSQVIDKLEHSIASYKEEYAVLIVCSV